MKGHILLAFVTASSITGSLLADSASTQLSLPLSFLAEGKDCVILFADDSNPFTSVSSVTTKVDIFTIKQISRGEWVLVEHPAAPDDYLKWNIKRRALAELSREKTDGRSTDQQRLQTLRDAANCEFPTATTWINLKHAAAISDVLSTFTEKYAAALE